MKYYLKLMQVAGDLRIHIREEKHSGWVIVGSTFPKHDPQQARNAIYAAAEALRFAGNRVEVLP